jgi:hypothetical protein
MRPLLAMAVVVAVVGVSHADPDFFGSSPGPLSPSHASLDSKDHCNDCHLNDSKELSNKKCLDCHDHQKLATRISAKQGFHASAKVAGKECKTCHDEHKGHDIMGWSSIGGEKNFDHATTGWPLNGAHKTTACKDCHKTLDNHGLRKYLGQDTQCGACHAKDQPHKFERKAMLACDRCHAESVWKPAKPEALRKFDHDDRVDALMPLFGAHRGVACAKCHPKSVFKLLVPKPDNCGNSGCHKSAHEGHLYNSKPCEWCHSPTFPFKQASFDHTERTKFDLRATHRKIQCYDCHTKSLGERKPTGACADCHEAKDDHHKGRWKAFGDPPPCQICHPSGGPTFTPSAFDHGARTKFKLEYKHAEATCRQCHRGKGPADFERFEFPNAQCMSCHQHEKVHADARHPNGKWKNKDCLVCHLHSGDRRIRTGRDNEIVQAVHGFDGSFPLVKRHAKDKDGKKVPCAKCHTGRDAKGETSFSDLEPNCNAAKQCHGDSLHQGTLGASCTLCHSPGTWDALLFDHQKPFPSDAQGKVKEFPLKGDHLSLSCERCHPAKKFVEANTTCGSEDCHAKDDAHKKRLGDKCEHCHTETRDVIFNHNKQSAFHLDGKHLEVRCVDCHPSITFKPRPTDCFGCHPEPKVHRGQYGTDCAQCHTTRTFDDVRPLHDVGDFALKGMHDNIACERCHRDNRPLAGSGNLCINCHRQDDIHGNSLSPRCGECHTQWSFAPARFDHSRVGCNLTGLHRTLACADCHRAGNYVGLSGTCAACHHDDALRAPRGASGYDGHPTTPTCANCHNPNTWVGASASTTTAAGFGRESVCR